MKKRNFYLLSLSCLCIIATSCSKNNRDDLRESNNSLLTNEVEKIETFLAEGATKQIITDPNVPKIETRASEETMAQLRAEMRKEVDESYKKLRVSTKRGPAMSPDAFAVFKSGGSCGGYQQLTIKMDCEDRRPATSQTGWVGNNYIIDGDIYLEFCVIDDHYNRYMGQFNDNGVTNAITGGAYGFLYLGETWYFQQEPGRDTWYPKGKREFFWPMFSLIRVFDNQDSNNGNKVWINGAEQPLSYWLGPTAHSQASYVSGNTRLHWIVAPPTSSATGGARKTIPGLAEYVLLGTFGSFQGGINIDDEDTNNRNIAEAGGYYAHTNVATGQRINNTFPGNQTIEGSDNTYLHLSRVY